MNIAFCLFNYFPYGGLQRDFIRIARTCVARGHEVHVYTMSWEGEQEPSLHIHLLSVDGRQNHVRNRHFASQVKIELDKQSHDIVVGFNKMPHLDVYYAADVCFKARAHEKHNWFYRLLPRYRQLCALEEAVFNAGNSTEILLIAKHQQKEFIRYYQTEENRFHLMPPGISKDRMAPVNASQIRDAVRTRYDLPEHDVLLLAVGSGFKTKGLDRSIRGLAALPEVLRESTHLFVIGDDKPDAFLQLADKLKVSEHVQFLGGRSDVPDFLLAADFLVHPAYHENTGTVLLEAVVAGLPVLTVDVCGYANYINDAKAGVVLSSPFKQDVFNIMLQRMLVSPERYEWKQNGLAFAKNRDIYSLTDKAADFIEEMRQQHVSA
jgi:UDP-glucose:(heptosyl)LPS alpha-1,3-glucosyltransferase